MSTDRDDPRLAKYAQALSATLGSEGRMISPSKSGYRERHPERVAIFNTNVCVASGQKVWHGDLDLTLDEPQLAALSKQIGEVVFLLYEGDGRFAHEQQPLLDKAVYSVTPTGHTRYQHRFIERTKDGTLHVRPREPDTRPRWNWRVLRHRPRLFHFWNIDRRTSTQNTPSSRERNTLVYVGARDDGATPLLILGCFRASHLRKLGFEWTWHPAQDPPRNAPRPLVSTRRPTVTIGRLQLWLTTTLWPGYRYELRAGYAVKQRWR